MLDPVAMVRAGVVAEAPITLQELWSSLDVCFFLQITLPECNSVFVLQPFQEFGKKQNMKIWSVGIAGKDPRSSPRQIL